MFNLWKAYHTVIYYHILSMHIPLTISSQMPTSMCRSHLAWQAESWPCRPLKSVTTAGFHLQTMDFLYEIYDIWVIMSERIKWHQRLLCKIVHVIWLFWSGLTNWMGRISHPENVIPQVCNVCCLISSKFIECPSTMFRQTESSWGLSAHFCTSCASLVFLLAATFGNGSAVRFTLSSNEAWEWTEKFWMLKG